MKVWKKLRSNVKHYLALNVKEIENSREMEYLVSSIQSFNYCCCENFIRKIPNIKPYHKFCNCRYSGHYFTTTLIYSILLGFLGMDRFCLGHTGTAVGKLLTLGGVGIWWIVDIVLLVSGGLMPEDGSNWEPVL